MASLVLDFAFASFSFATGRFEPDFLTGPAVWIWLGVFALSLALSSLCPHDAVRSPATVRSAVLMAWNRDHATD